MISAAAKLYKTDNSSIGQGIFGEDDKIWHPITDNEIMDSYDESVGSIQ